MARTICVQLPIPEAPPSFTVPGMGTVGIVKNFGLEAYDQCSDARASVLAIQPVLAALGMPLCFLQCLTSVVNVFGSDFPYVKPQQLLKLPNNCACLTSFTPFGFCGLVRGLLGSISNTLGCMMGLLADLVRMETQSAALIADPTTQFAGKCLSGQTEALRRNVVDQFKPIMLLYNSSSFLFNFVGISPPPMNGDPSDMNTGELLVFITSTQTVINGAFTAVNNICPEELGL